MESEAFFLKELRFEERELKASGFAAEDCMVLVILHIEDNGKQVPPWRWKCFGRALRCLLNVQAKLANGPGLGILCRMPT